MVQRRAPRRLPLSAYRELADILELKSGERLKLRPQIDEILYRHPKLVSVFDEDSAQPVIRGKIKGFADAYAKLEEATENLDARAREKLKEHGQGRSTGSLLQLKKFLAEHRQLSRAALQAADSLSPAKPGERRKPAIEITIEYLASLYDATARHPSEDSRLHFVAYALEAAGIHSYKATSLGSYLARIIRQRT